MDLGLKGKVAVVTGASAGIGRAIALGLAAEGVFLASERARWVTGECICVDGGQHKGNR